MTQAMLILFTPTLELDARGLSLALAFTHSLCSQTESVFLYPNRIEFKSHGIWEVGTQKICSFVIRNRIEEF